MERFVHVVAATCAGLLALAGAVSADGHARVVIPFDLETDGAAEGVAVDWKGDVFAGLSAQGRMLKITGGDGEAQELAVLEGLAEGDFGFTGHAFNSDSRLYSGVVSANPELNGLVAIQPETGEWSHVAGTEQMAMANGLDTDGWGTLYVADTILGAVWRVMVNGDTPEFQPIVDLWIQDPLLKGTGELPYPFPIGANGVDVRGDGVYVANTEQQTVVVVPFDAEGGAGKPFVYAELPDVSVDGIAFDWDDNLYIADPPAHTLWLYAPDGTLTAVADVDDGLSGPSSVALWQDEDELVAYVRNQAIGPVDIIKHGPSIIAVTLE